MSKPLPHKLLRFCVEFLNRRLINLLAWYRLYTTCNFLFLNFWSQLVLKRLSGNTSFSNTSLAAGSLGTHLLARFWHKWRLFLVFLFRRSFLHWMHLIRAFSEIDVLQKFDWWNIQFLLNRTDARSLLSESWKRWHKEGLLLWDSDRLSWGYKFDGLKINIPLLQLFKKTRLLHQLAWTTNGYFGIISLIYCVVCMDRRCNRPGLPRLSVVTLLLSYALIHTIVKILAASVACVQISKNIALSSWISLFKSIFEKCLSSIFYQISRANMFWKGIIIHFIFNCWIHLKIVWPILVAWILRSRTSQVRCTVLMQQLDAVAAWLIWSFLDYPSIVIWGFNLVKRTFNLVFENQLIIWLLNSNFKHHVVIRMGLWKRLLIGILILVEIFTTGNVRMYNFIAVVFLHAISYVHRFEKCTRI